MCGQFIIIYNNAGQWRMFDGGDECLSVCYWHRYFCLQCIKPQNIRIYLHKVFILSTKYQVCSTDITKSKKGWDFRKVNSDGQTCSPVAVGWWGMPTDALWNLQRCTPVLDTSHSSLPRWPFPAWRSHFRATERGENKWQILMTGVDIKGLISFDLQPREAVLS